MHSAMVYNAESLNKTKYITLKEDLKEECSKWKQRTKKKTALCLQCLALPLSASVSSGFCEKRMIAIRKSLRAFETNSEIDEAYQFEKKTGIKAEALKQEMESAEQYKRQKTLMR
ncbi:MAG: hypothetical protein ACLRWM_01060 [Streptococcus sp.]